MADPVLLCSHGGGVSKADTTLSERTDLSYCRLYQGLEWIASNIKTR